VRQDLQRLGVRGGVVDHQHLERLGLLQRRDRLPQEGAGVEARDDDGYA
jgi:hypothetical protein